MIEGHVDRWSERRRMAGGRLCPPECQLQIFKRQTDISEHGNYDITINTWGVFFFIFVIICFSKSCWSVHELKWQESVTVMVGDAFVPGRCPGTHLRLCVASRRLCRPDGMFFWLMWDLGRKGLSWLLRFPIPAGRRLSVDVPLWGTKLKWLKTAPNVYESSETWITPFSPENYAMIHSERWCRGMNQKETFLMYDHLHGWFNKRLNLWVSFLLSLCPCAWGQGLK